MNHHLKARYECYAYMQTNMQLNKSWWCLTFAALCRHFNCFSCQLPSLKGGNPGLQSCSFSLEVSVEDDQSCSFQESHGEGDCHEGSEEGVVVALFSLFTFKLHQVLLVSHWMI